ncbi:MULTISPECIES: envelope stress response membrane protein PspC [Corallincola]|uniref:Envelope stress response membrane protein PspC n=3 Tax=Corallincola TaxID=1775176 RepID=A0A368N219_9GAMM|nr:MULTISPECIES: envelope stress response membrane protein PspC [Corallincola]RCU43664.1 envelope stress response membrane protein PspC [Corallincola holothuriorum]TAA42741.1 envelope stress response membrane protein PspC [Corallincola spongiicola]TCI01608.1 envelope stress response membrane protein PspC [Corallincola luteus]
MDEQVKKKQLYRSTSRQKLAGVCAGLADYFGFEVWLVRVVVASAIILTGVFGLPLLAYVVLWLVLDKAPEGNQFSQPPHTVKSHVWQAGEPPRQAFKEVVTRFEKLELRLRRLEQVVTSSEFSLKREINKL